ncbi:cytochrome P450 [Apiospora saccharicola]|uniref:Cytochrome P450 n=1 Tax=Apiospora saccharicola TaxID=335842 RepID=A0ABR1VNP9_9PEZI
MTSFAIPLLAGLLAIYCFLYMRLQSTQDAREPPFVDAGVPFLSVLARIGWQGLSYWHRHAGLPIITLRLPYFRIYVVNSTKLIPIVQRHVSTFSFSPILVDMSARFMAVSKKTYEIISRDPMDDHGFVAGMSRATHAYLSPGSMLDSLNEASVRILADSLGTIDNKGPQHVSMKEWVDKEITMAATEAIYGPLNPYRDPAVFSVWPDYENGLAALLLNILPAFTARMPGKARDTLVRAYEKYYARGGHRSASAFIRNRCEFYLLRGVPYDDIARIEVGASIGFTSNTKPAAFWLLYHVCSDPALLDACRQELMSKAVVRTEESSGILTIDIARVKSACPILFAAFKETFRVHSIGISMRRVVEDDVLDNKYLLKKGSYLLIPSAVQHRVKSIWGENVDRFDHTRFLQEEGSSSRQKSRRPNPVAFRAFGGGSTLCPGRHFATTEVLAFVALTIMRLDIRPLATGGRWVMPTVGKSKPNVGLDQPDYDLEVELVPRDEGGIEWRIAFPGSGEPMRVSAEDG